MVLCFCLSGYCLTSPFLYLLDLLVNWQKVGAINYYSMKVETPRRLTERLNADWSESPREEALALPFVDNT